MSDATAPSRLDDADRKRLKNCLHWFSELQHVGPRLLADEDYVLAKEIYDLLGMPVPHSILRRIISDSGKAAGA